jgi:hypothetical protein
MLSDLAHVIHCILLRCQFGGQAYLIIGKSVNSPTLARVFGLNTTLFSFPLSIKSALVENYRLQAQAHLCQANRQQAQDFIEKSSSLARELGMKREEGLGLRSAGQVRVDNKHSEQAIPLFEQSLAILAGIDPYEAARTKMQYDLATVNDILRPLRA